MNAEASSGSNKDRDDDYFRTCYGTLAYSSIPVILFALSYWFEYRDFFPGNKLQADLGFSASLLAGLLLALALIMQGGKLFERLITVSNKWRARLLPVAAVTLICNIALACSLTGGAISSPFAHFLTAAGGLTIVFARLVKTQIVIGVSTIIAFALSSNYVFQPCPTQPGGPPPPCDGSHLPSMIVFHCIALAIVSGLAILAITRQLPKEAPIRVADYNVKIEYPVAGDLIDTIDVKGTIARPIPNGYVLRVFRIYPDSNRFVPLGEARFINDGTAWVAERCSVGGKPGDKRGLAVYIVGASGEALVSFHNEAVSIHSKAMDAFRLATGNDAQFLPPVAERTQDMYECDRVAVIRA